MEVDLQMLGVDNNVQIAVASCGFHKRVIADGLSRGDTDSLIVMAATASYDVGYLCLLSRDTHVARVALIGVGVASDQCVGTDASRFAGVVNLLEHDRAATVTALAEGRMMDADDQGLASTGFARCDYGFESVGEPRDLLLIAARAFAASPCDVAFSRSEIRHRQRKVLADCGHWIDGSRRRLTPYRYTVEKVVGEPGVRQRLDCEECARSDLKAWRR